MPPDNPPPKYTAGPVSASFEPSTAEDPYAFLTIFDTIFLIDDSGSMKGHLWSQTSAALETITPICTSHDANGVDIYFINKNDSPFYKNIKSPSTIVKIFQEVSPWGGTLTGVRLNHILTPYLKRYKEHRETTKPINIIVITDGEPSDDVETPIIDAAKKLDKLEAPAWQVGIQFFQVGRSPGAREKLQKLDNELKNMVSDENLRDMVDTVPFTGDDGGELTDDGIMKVVLGSVNRRLDRNSKGLHHSA